MMEGPGKKIEKFGASSEGNPTELASHGEALEAVPPGWRTNHSLVAESERSFGFISNAANKYRLSNPEWFKKYKGETGHTLEHYSPELVNLVIQKGKEHTRAPDGWLTMAGISSALGVDREAAARIGAVFISEHPELSGTYLDRAGKSTTHYGPILKEKIQEYLLNLNRPPDWKLASSLAKEIGKDIETLDKQAAVFANDEALHIRKFMSKSGLAKYYSPELAARLREYFLSLEKAPDGWLSNKEAVELLGVTKPTVATAVEAYQKEHQTSVREYLNQNGRLVAHYSPELISYLSSRFKSVERVPSGWKTVGALREQFGKSSAVISGSTESFRQSHPEWFRQFRTKQGIREHYSPELVAEIPALLSEDIPEGWKREAEIASELGIDHSSLGNAMKRFVEINKDKKHSLTVPSIGRRKLIEYYSPEAQEHAKQIFSERLTLPEGWKRSGTFAVETGINKMAVQKAVEAFVENNPQETHKRAVTSLKSGTVFYYYSPEAFEYVARSFKERNNAKEAILAQEELENQYSLFIREVSDDQTIEAEEFKKLLGMFGSAHLFDILYKFRPEFKGISAEHVKGTLAKYLGDFLILNNGFKLDDLDLAYPYLSDQSLQGSLFEVLKEDTLAYYHERKLRDPSANDHEIIGEHITLLRSKAESLNSSELLEVVDRTEAYYRSLLEDFKKPENLVDKLQEGRPFPDLNQTLNIKEVSEKKRMLIGDEMGMGKSASAIFSKEYLGSKLALVVVPSNVIRTWQNYLSEKTEDNGEQIGYFKKGMAPRVLTIEDINSLSELDTSQYDYVLISQERISTRYVPLLKELEYDMLILDEVHKFKNLASGARSHNMLELAEDLDPENEHLVMLSGTPIPNKIRDVAMVLKLLYPDRFKNIEDAELVESVIQGDLIDIRNLLVPRMQMKTLRESIKMPELREETNYTQLSDEEKDIYEILLEDDELTADQKIRAFRKFTMNPSSLEVTPNIEGSKIRDVNARLNDVFAEKDKVVLFVNGYVEGMIRGENTILDKLSLPDGVIVRVIEGNIGKEERDAIQAEFKNAKGKILLAISGQTADVGVDFSAAEYMEFYNDPWTLYDKKQQIARGYRPGLKNDLTVSTSIVEGTIEEGIQEYIQLKYDAIQKVLKGVPITEIEKGILRTAEKQRTQDIEGSLEIAKEWLSSPQSRLHRFFGATKEIGEKQFHEFLLEHGDEYAESYLDMGSLGFQANTSRIVGTLINHFVEEQKQTSEQLRILDIASGPEMLKKHVPDALQRNVFSLDINPSHFQETGEGRVVGSFTRLPIAGESMDYVNLSLALHYSRLTPRRGDYERIAVLTEMNRVLKAGGRAVINLLYSIEFKDNEQFKELANSLGFNVVEDYSGDISSGPYYKSNVVVLEKDADIDAKFEDLVKTIPKAQINGAKFRDTGVSSLKNSRKCVKTFFLNDSEMRIKFNTKDKRVLDEQESILAEGEALREKYGSIKAIPSEEIVENSFLRIYNGRNYRLLKKSKLLNSFVDIR